MIAGMRYILKPFLYQCLKYGKNVISMYLQVNINKTRNLLGVPYLSVNGSQY